MTLRCNSNHVRALLELENIYRNALTYKSGQYHTTLNTFTDQLFPLSAEIVTGVAEVIYEKLPSECEVVVGEEDKGASIVTAVSMISGKPFSLARSYRAGLIFPDEINYYQAAYSSEYDRGVLTLWEGLSNTNVVVVEDTISTGGTLSTMLDLLAMAGANVLKCISVVEKSGNGGVALIKQRYGIDVDVLLSIQITDGIVSVLP